MILQVGVKAVLKREDGKILLVKRNAQTYTETVAKWDIPGGRIHLGSPLMDNLAREVREETSLSLTSVPKLIGAQDILKGEEKHVVRLTYTAYTTGDPVLDVTENDEYKWCTFEEIENEDLLDNYVRALITSGALHADAW